MFHTWKLNYRDHFPIQWWKKNKKENCKKSNQQYEKQPQPRFYAEFLDQIFMELNLPLHTASLSKCSTITQN